MKNKIISGFITALMCIAPVGMPYVFRSVEVSAAVTAHDDETLAGYAERVWEIVNEERAKEGLAPVAFSAHLNYAANIRAEEIIKNSGHIRPDGSSWNNVFNENNISVSSCGENILNMTNMFPVPDIAMTAWMGSQVHHDNIMNGNYTNIGVGVAQDGGSYYLVQVFANEAVSWDVSDGKFTIDGIGRTPSYAPENRPWNDSAESITSVSVGGEITEIGRYVFSGMNNLKSVTLPENVKKIDFYAFYECSSLGEVTFRNPECEIEGSTETIPSGAVICGYENSTAQTFAETNGYTFRILEDVPVVYSLGDVNADGEVNAVDASAVLMEYAALSTEDSEPAFTDEQKTAADVNADGEINAVDGSYILVYYAYLSTGDGVKTDMSEWIKTAYVS